MIPVTLNWAEMMQAAVVGVVRHAEALKRQLEDQHGLQDDGSGWLKHIEGACGEMAFAKAVNVYSALTINTFCCPYIGRIQVRTRSRQIGRAHV